MLTIISSIKKQWVLTGSPVRAIHRLELNFCLTYLCELFHKMQKISPLLIALSLLIPVMSISQTSFKGILPDSLQADWQRAGIESYFAYPGNRIGVKDFGATGNGITDDTQAFINAILSLGGNEGVILIAEGDYLISSTLNIPSNIVLKGEGAGKSNLLFNLGNQPIDCITMSGQAASDFYLLQGAYNKNSSYILCSQSSYFEAGNLIELRQENGGWNTQPATWADYSVGQMIRVQSVSGDTLFLKTPLRIQYHASLNPEIRKIEPIQNTALECFSIKRIDNPGNGGGYNIGINLAAACRILGVHSEKSNASHVHLNSCHSLRIEGCYFYDAFQFDGTATRGYGVTLSMHTGECLIQDNIFRKLRHAMMVKTGANGNVFGYNYSIEPYRSELIHDFSGDISLHGHFAYTNLFESNICQNIIIDHYWGPSGPGNAFFRNRAELYGIIMTTPSGAASNGQIFCGNEITKNQFGYGQFTLTGAQHFSYGNNKLGISVPPGTNDFSDTSWYLQDPIFWNLSNPLPSVGYPNTLNTGSIPARERYLAGGELCICPDINTAISEKTNIGYPEYIQSVIIINGVLHVTLQNSNKEFLEIKVYNTLGQTLISRQTKEYLLKTSMPDQSVGSLYIIEVRGKNGRDIQKLMSLN